MDKINDKRFKPNQAVGYHPVRYLNGYDGYHGACMSQARWLIKTSELIIIQMGY